MNQRKEKTMFKTKLQYVSWNDSVPGSAILVSTQAGLFSGLMVYKNPNYKKGQ
jgi:hypothetical protein